MTDKPIMINNPKTLENIPLFEPTCIYSTEDKLWFSVRRINALFCMDKENRELEFVGSFPRENHYTVEFNDSLYRTPVEHNGILYFPPFLANELATYSPQTRKFEKIKYKDSEKTDTISKDFLDAIAYGDYIYFSPNEYPAILRLNVKSMEITHHTDWMASIKELTGNKKETLFGRSILSGKSMWFSVLSVNAIMEFNLESLLYTIYELGEKDYRYGMPYFDGVNFWLPPLYNTKTPVVKWNPKTGAIKEFPEVYSNNEVHTFLSFIMNNGYLWLLPAVGEHAIKIDINTETLSIAYEFESGPAKSENGTPFHKYVYALSYGDSIYTYLACTSEHVEYNCVKKERRKEVKQYSSKTSSQLEPLYRQIFLSYKEELDDASDCYYCEGPYIRLKDYLTNILDDKNDRTKTPNKRRKRIDNKFTKNLDGTAGTEIFDYIKKLMAI